MNEIWKDVIGYEDSYEISNTGILKSKTRIVDYGWKKAIRPGKILKLRIGKYGYLYQNVSLNKKRMVFKPHRLVAIHFIDNPLNLPQVNHKDGNKLNNNDWNLEWNTAKQNVSHAYSIGLRSGIRGENSHYAKLSQIDIDNIRKEYNLGNISQLKLGLKYNISQSQIYRIVNFKNWI